MAQPPGTLSDVKSIGKCSDFSGNDNEWLNWKFKFEAWFVLALGDLDRDIDALLKGAEDHDGPVIMTDLSDGQAKAARVLYAALVNLCRGKALTLARRCGRGEGFELWRRLCVEYQSSVGARTTAMLVGVLTPHWDDSRPFLDVLSEWELGIEDYEAQAQDLVSEAVKCAVVLKHAPPEVRKALQTHVAAIGSDYDKLRAIVRSMLTDAAAYDAMGARAPDPRDAGGGPQPMQVDAAWQTWKGGKSKGKEKGKWNEKGGKAKGKKGKYGDKGGKGKGKEGPAGKGKGGASEPFQGYCGYCEAWGHKRADCRKRLAVESQQKGAAALQQQQLIPPPSGSSSSTAPSANSGVRALQAKTEWLLALREEKVSAVVRSCSFALMDSGSDVHMCPDIVLRRLA